MNEPNAAVNDVPLGGASSRPKISVVIQGGAMRSIYCVGATRALAEHNLIDQVRTIHAASAGCVSSVLLTAISTSPTPIDVREITARLLEQLASDRFINPRRIACMVDVDYLADIMIKETGLSMESLRRSNTISEVVLTSSNGEPVYVDLAAVSSIGEVRTALRGTMAIPVLYPRAVSWKRQRVYDGGIVDPLPIRRALQTDSDVVIAISNVARGTLGDPPAEGKEALIIRALPVVPRAVKSRMLGRIVLGDDADELLDHGQDGRQLVPIWPSNPDILGSRLEKRLDRLHAVEEMGYDNAVAQLSAAGLISSFPPRNNQPRAAESADHSNSAVGNQTTVRGPRRGSGRERRLSH